MNPVAKVLIISGVVFIIAGILWQLGWIQSLKLGRLPGDIVVENENVKFYFPITTMIIISALLSLVGWFFRK